MQVFKTIAAASFLALAALGLSGPVSAGDYNGDFMVRIGGSVVHPDSGASVALDGMRIAGDADVSTEFIPSATLTYFFNPNLSVELFCCFAKHDAKGKGGIAGLGELADFWIFPPALTLQYHFTGLGGIKPYVGAGVQYIHFFNEDTALGRVDIDDAWGFTLQAGVDVELGQGWYINADVKKTWLDTEARWTNTGLGDTGVVDADIDVDPWIFSVNLGYRFNLFGSRHVEPLK